MWLFIRISASQNFRCIWLDEHSSPWSNTVLRKSLPWTRRRGVGVRGRRGHLNRHAAAIREALSRLDAEAEGLRVAEHEHMLGDLSESGQAVPAREANCAWVVQWQALQAHVASHWYFVAERLARFGFLQLGLVFIDELGALLERHDSPPVEGARWHADEREQTGRGHLEDGVRGLGKLQARCLVLERGWDVDWLVEPRGDLVEGAVRLLLLFKSASRFLCSYFSGLGPAGGADCGSGQAADFLVEQLKEQSFRVVDKSLARSLLEMVWWVCGVDGDGHGEWRVAWPLPLVQFAVSSYADELREHAAYFGESYALAVLMDINKEFVKA